MREILKALREQKKVSLDIYQKGANLAMWVILEKDEVLVMYQDKIVTGTVIKTEEQGDELQDNLLDNGYVPVKIDDKVIKKMEKIQKEMMKKALGF